MQNKFEIMEQNGRNILLNYFTNNPELQVDQILFEIDNYASTDCVYWSGLSFNKTYAEIKTRSYSKDKTWQAQPQGWIFEKIKWKALQSKIKGTTNRACFIVICQDAILIFDVTNKFKEEDFVFYNYSTNYKKQFKKDKEVTWLTNDQASHILPFNFNFNNKTI